MKKESPLFYIKEDTYSGSHSPYFYNTGDFPWVKKIEEQWEIMRDEIESYFSKGGDIEGFSSHIPAPSAGWRNLYFMNFLWIQYRNCKRFPKTWDILRQVPGLTFAAIGILEPKSKVLPHNGPTNINLRCQLPIKIPAKHPVCGIKVEKEEQGWEEGKILIFSDSNNHCVWNDSDETRIVLVFDILKKDFESQRLWMCAQYLASVSLRFVDLRISFIKRTPDLVLNIFHKIISIGWSIYLEIQLKFQFLLKKPKYK